MNSGFKYTEPNGTVHTCLENVCPVFPIKSALQKISLNSEMQDGYIMSRPRISRNFNIYQLSFKAESWDVVKKLKEFESIVGTSEIFTWLPNAKLDPKDDLAIQERRVRIVNPINYQWVSPQYFDFDITLMEA